MADPLSLLRQYNISKKEIIEENGQIIFGEFSWPRNEKTNFLMFRAGKDGRPKEYYTLECLLFFLKNNLLPHPVYIQRAVAENIPIVHRPDRRDVLAYLNGEIASCRSIDRSAPLEIPNQVEISPCTDNSRAEMPVKKPRLELQMSPVSRILDDLVTKKNTNVPVDRLVIAETIMHEFLLFNNFVEEGSVDSCCKATIPQSRYKYKNCHDDFWFVVSYIPAPNEISILMKRSSAKEKSIGSVFIIDDEIKLKKETHHIDAHNIGRIFIDLTTNFNELWTSLAKKTEVNSELKTEFKTERP